MGRDFNEYKRTLRSAFGCHVRVATSAGTCHIQELIGQDDLEDDAFCESLSQKYMDDPDRGKFVSEEDLAKEFGIEL